MFYKRKIAELKRQGYEFLCIVNGVSYSGPRSRRKTKEQLAREYWYLFKKHRHIKIGPTLNEFGNPYTALVGIYVKK